MIQKGVTEKSILGHTHTHTTYEVKKSNRNTNLNYCQYITECIMTTKIFITKSKTCKISYYNHKSAQKKQGK